MQNFGTVKTPFIYYYLHLIIASLAHLLFSLSLISLMELKAEDSKKQTRGKVRNSSFSVKSSVIFPVK